MWQTFTGNIYELWQRTVEVPEKIDIIRSYYSK